MNVQDLIDRTEIFDLQRRYTEALDQRDWELMREIFTDDAVADFSDGLNVRGVDEIIAVASGAMGAYEATHHTLSNPQCTVDGDRATAGVYLVSGHLAKVPDGYRELIGRGAYRDVLVRTDAGWRISERVLTFAWTQQFQ